jgi:hypothetical protein
MRCVTYQFNMGCLHAFFAATQFYQFYVCSAEYPFKPSRIITMVLKLKLKYVRKVGSERHCAPPALKKRDTCTTGKKMPKRGPRIMERAFSSSNMVLGTPSLHHPHKETAGVQSSPVLSYTS